MKANAGMGSKRILLVEDDLAVGYVFRRYLDAAGFHVLMAENGRDALALHAAQPVDAVITDFRMPGMHGDELLLALRARQPGLPAMVVSAFGHELKLAIPGVRVLAKPVMGDRLVAELHSLLLDAETVALNRPAG